MKRIVKALGFAEYGADELLIAIGSCGVAAYALSLVNPYLAVIPAIPLAIVLWFFRDPNRSGPQDGDLLLSPADGTVVVAGQSHDTATAYGGDVLSWRAAREGHPQPLPVAPSWVERLQRLDPARVVFAHDHAVWVP